MRPAAIILIALFVLSSCSPVTRQAGEQAEPTTRVRVENQRLLDMTIYILYDSQRVRLGTVPSLNTRVFVIPERLLTGVSSIRFLADPIGSRQAPVTQELTVFPGEEIELLITN